MAADRTTRKRRIGFLEQVDWDTPFIASSLYETLSYNAGSIKIDPAVTLNTFDVTGTSGLVPKQSRAFVDNVSGLPTISFTAPATKKTLAVHLVAALQGVIEGATTPFIKSVYPYWNTDVPDFFASTGSTLHLFTIATDNITGTDGVLLENALLNDFTLTIEPNNQGIAKLAQISGTWIGNEMNLGTNFSGSWVAESLTGFYNDTDAFSLTVSGLATLSDYCWKKFQLTINNNVTTDCRTASKANNYKVKPTMTATVTLPYDSSTYALLTAHKAGTTGYVLLGHGAGDTDGDLNIYVYGRITVAPLGTDGDYESIELTVTAEYNTVASKSVFITIVDTQDRGWPAS